MLQGTPPFRAGSEYLTFQRILLLDYHLPDHMPESAQNVIKLLLQRDPNARLGKPEAPGFIENTGPILIFGSIRRLKL